MTEPQELDLLNIPLAGTNLVEASAGTGKTYAITGLFLRLLLEKKIPINEILVVTYTDAATAELRDRVRRRLQEALEAFLQESSQDKFLDSLIKNYPDDDSRKKAGIILEEASRDFDQAAIYTIHGFCHRVLRENAFESNNLFEAELIIDQNNLLREIVADFWRKNFYEASPLFVNFINSKGFNQKSILELVKDKLTQPGLEIIPEVSAVDTAQLEQEFQTCFAEVCLNWESSNQEVKEILFNDPGLNRNKFSTKNLDGWFESMALQLAGGNNNPIFFDKFIKFTAGHIESSIKKGHTPPDHSFFHSCEKLSQAQQKLLKAFQQNLCVLKKTAIPYVQQELARKKQQRNIKYFDDLLLNVYEALNGPKGDVLAETVRKKFKAALIDEFQDTDQLQYTIFHTIFAADNRILFLIGDPKQSIYGFRNADIFAYLKAVNDVSCRYTLGTNWRSEKELIKAVNCIFETPDQPFVYDEIQFLPVAAAQKDDPTLLRINGNQEAPMHLWFLDGAKVDKPGEKVTVEQAQRLIPQAVTAEISNLISLGRQKKAFLGDHPLQENDIAVLVRTNDQAKLMQEALRKLNIHSVLYSTGNLFDAPEALNLQRLLMSIIEPNNERNLRVALITDIVGVKAAELEALSEDENQWNQWLDKIGDYHQFWKDHDFIGMFRRFVVTENVLDRLMAFPDGERRCTNILHMAEVLHEISLARNLGMAGLVKWLAQQRDPDSQRSQEHQLRLESDDNAVKLVTIHKSKGLEYPIVFYPFVWTSERKGEDHFLFHDEASGKLIFDLGSPEREENRQLYNKEQLAENLRLFYVALTRAKNRNYCIWGNFKEGVTSAAQYIFTPSNENPTEADKNGSQFPAAWIDIQSRAPGAMKLAELPLSPGEKQTPPQGQELQLECRHFTGHIDRQWNIASFSSLTAKYPHVTELADRDVVIASSPSYETQEPKPPATDTESLSFFSFPHGNQAGIMLHEVFEDLDFTREDMVEKVAGDKLAAYGFEPRWQEPLVQMVHKVLSAPLNSTGVMLSNIDNNNRLNELEFYFPLKLVSPKQLFKVLKEFGGPSLNKNLPEKIGKLDFAPVRGYMNGVIDLVFQSGRRYHLVDWKSHLLGYSIEDYDQRCLKKVMADKFYNLQYLIYVVALDQYLKNRLPDYNYETNFGEVFYIFLRGIDPAQNPDFGIYRDRPSADLVNALNNLLLDSSMIIP